MQGGSSKVYIMDYSLEPETRRVMEELGGEQPSEYLWGLFFGRHSGGCSAEMDEKMKKAHDIAKERANP